MTGVRLVLMRWCSLCVLVGKLAAEVPADPGAEGRGGAPRGAVRMDRDGEDQRLSWTDGFRQRKTLHPRRRTYQSVLH